MSLASCASRETCNREEREVTETIRSFGIWHINLAKSSVSFIVALATLLPWVTFAAPVQCECIRALREVRGINVRGDAYTIPVTHPLENAVEGDVLLLDMGILDHGAEIIGFEGDQNMGTYIAPQFILVWTANWPLKCGVSIERISWNDPRIKGIYRPLANF